VSTGNVLLAAYATWWVACLHDPRQQLSAKAADQRLKAPALHAMNNRKLVTWSLLARPDEAEAIYQLSAG